MAISMKDSKILWTRAMGLCSIPECRRKLLISSPDGGATPTVIGEHCHIVGEKPSSPRGTSDLSDEDRDRYPNLILLCPEHHKIIDDNPTHWTIERLHQVKADHEVWVETRIPDLVGDIHMEIYAGLVNAASTCLCLPDWPDITAGAVLDRLPNRFVDGVYQLSVAITAAHWPGRFANLEAELRNTSVRASSYVDLFMARAMPDGTSWKQDNRWKNRWRNDYHEELAKVMRWARGCNRLLMNLTVAANALTQTVRDTVQPTFFLSAGRFYVVDFMGMYSDLQPMVYFPETYDERPVATPEEVQTSL